MIGITDWLESFNTLPSTGIQSSNCVEGVCKKVLGGRSLFAKVELYFQPADELIFDSALPEELYKYYLEEQLFRWIGLGVLDIMLLRPISPRNQFRCTIKNIEYHPIDSSGQAFRLAARYAAEKFISTEPFLVC